MELFQQLTKCTRGVRVVFPDQKCAPVTMIVCMNLTLLQRKSRSVHMTMFEIYIYSFELEFPFSVEVNGLESSENIHVGGNLRKVLC